VAESWIGVGSGVIAATLTPFNAEGPDREGIGRLVEFLVERGVAGMMVGGTTGEFVTMAPPERVQVIAEFVASVDGRVPVVANTGHLVRSVARDLTKKALEIGVDAITAIAPYFHRHDEEAIESYFRDLSETAGDRPFLIYDFPGATGNAVGPGLLEKLLDLPNLAGVKASVASPGELDGYLRLRNRTTIISGNDGLLPHFIENGGRLIVSGTASVYPELMVRLTDKLLQGDVHESDLELLDVLVAVGKGGSPDVFKFLLRRRGLDVGQPRISTCTERQLESLLPMAEKSDRALAETIG